MAPAQFPRSTLILGFDPKTALAVARPLHRRGIRVVVATISPWEEPLRSRAVAAFVALPRADRPEGEFMAALRRAIEEHGVDLVIPVTDIALTRLMPHLAAVRGLARVACPPDGALARVLDKDATRRTARELGVPMPATLGEDGIGTVRRFPVFAKCRDKMRRGGPEPRKIDDAAAWREFSAGGSGAPDNVLLQEFIPGCDVGLALLVSGGRVVARFQYLAVKTLPVEAGSCVLARSEPVDPEMEDHAVRMLRALAWEGLAQFDFRRDPATGKCVLLEINARFWGTTGAAVAAGVDFPHYVWQIAHGETPAPPAGYRRGMLVRWTEGDVRRLAGLWTGRGTGKSGTAAFWREAAGLLADCRPWVRGLLWSWRDPWPAFGRWWQLAHWWIVARLRAGSR